MRIVRLQSVWDDEADELGISFEESRVCKGFSTALCPFEDENAEDLHLPPIPGPESNWLDCFIGGISRTQRRCGVLRGKEGAERCSFFAVNLSRGDAVHSLFSGGDWASRVTLGQAVYDAEEGWCVEVSVHNAERDLSLVSARVARLGVEVLMDEASLEMEAGRCLGIERLDRIDAEITRTEDDGMRDDDGHYGLRRGVSNWQMAWQPPHWRLPSCTWDHLVLNVKDSDELTTMPRILLQHVAKFKLKNLDFHKFGTLWKRLENEKAPTFNLPEPLSACFRGPAVRLREVPEGVAANSVVRAPDGSRYAVWDEEAFLVSQLQSTRLVSSHLSTEQSRQLITAYYLVCVERHQDATVAMAARLVLFQYLVQLGYFARWYGQYRKTALHVGNGARLRRFRRLQQYEVQNLPTIVLNQWLDNDGTVKPNGSASVRRRGSRSKYKSENSYVPKRRKTRTEEDERRMLGSDQN